MSATARRTKAFAPATIANVGCAFDVLGIALGEPGDTVIAERTSEPGVRISSIEGDGGVLPSDPASNICGIVARLLLEKASAPFGVTLQLAKGLGIGTGLGSSSASSVASLTAVNALLEEPLDRNTLLPLAMEGERAACGSAHADNVAPALFGGVVLIRSYSPLDVTSLPYPPLWCVVVCPDVEVRTSDARRILKASVPLSLAVKQWGNIAGLVAGLTTKEPGLIARSLEDVIIEPERAVLIPAFPQAKAAALTAGALGCSISGSGPSLFALCATQEVANAARQGMINAFAKASIAATGYVSPINPHGAVVEVLA